MSLQWIPKIDGQDFVLAKDVNDLADAIIANEQEIERQQTDFSNLENELGTVEDELKNVGEELETVRNSNRVFFGVCNSGSDVIARLVELDDASYSMWDKLRDGDTLFVRMVNILKPSGGSTLDSGLSLNVHLASGWTGAKKAYTGHTTSVWGIPSNAWHGGAVIRFTYEASPGYWIANDLQYAQTNEYMGMVRLVDDIDSNLQFGHAATPNAVKNVNSKVDAYRTRLADLEKLVNTIDGRTGDLISSSHTLYDFCSENLAKIEQLESRVEALEEKQSEIE